MGLPHLATVDVALLAAAFLYRSPGEDAAGTGLRLASASIYALALATVLVLYRVVKTPWLRAALLTLMTLPLLSICYGVWLSA